MSRGRYVVRRGLLALVVVAAAVAPLPSMTASGQSAGPRRVPIADFTPLPPARPVSAQTAELRERLLGDRWDNPDYVTLHWIGVSSFVITIGGHLLLFDAWEIIGAVEDYLPLGREELAGLAPEAVLVGHGHFDHAGDLGYVAGTAKSVVVGSDEICTVGEQGAVREGVGTDFTCAVTGTMTTPAQGVAQPLRLFADLPAITVLQHIHSNTAPPGNGNEPDPFVPIMDPQPYLDHFQDNPAELARFLAQQDESNQGGTWMYHFRIGDFTLLVGDSAGPIFSTPAVRAALDSFPGCVDVMANAILGFDQPVSGLQDPRLYVEHAHPKVFVPTHGDAWAPVISAGQEQYRAELAAQLARLPNPPVVDHLVDPQDYLAERAYRVADPRWVPAMPGSRCATALGAQPAPRPAPDVPPPAAAPLPSTGVGTSVAVLALAVTAAGLGARRRAIRRTVPDFAHDPPTGTYPERDVEVG